MNDFAQKLKKSKLFTRLDIFVLAVVIIACLLPLFALLGKDEGTTVRVYYNDSVTTYDIAKDAVINLKDEKIQVVIRDKSVWIERSDCDNAQCVHSGKISMSGESIVCLPNQLVVKIVGDAFDASTGGGL